MPPLVSQESDFDCGPAALLSVLRHWRAYDGAERDLYEPLGTTVRWGTDPDAMAAFARSLGLIASVRQDVTIDELRAALADGVTPILAIQAWSQESVDLDKTCKEGHYVVAVEVDGERDLLVMDPATADEGYAYIPLDELPGRWHDVFDGECREHLTIFIKGRRAVPENPMPKTPFTKVESLSEMVTFDQTPYRNVRLIDTAKLLSGAVHAKPLNPKLVAKLIGRLVGGLEASVIGVEGRADADRFSKMIRSALGELVDELRPVLPEAFTPVTGGGLGPFDIHILKRPGEPDPMWVTVKKFESACGTALEAFRRIGVKDSLLAGVVCMQPGTKANPAGLYLKEEDSVRINSSIFEEPQKVENLAEWSIIHEVAHRVWYRLAEAARKAWAAFIAGHLAELPTKYAGMAGPDEAWADAVADLALLPEGGVGAGASRAVLRAVRSVLKDAAETVTFEELREVWNTLAPAFGRQLHELGGKAEDPPKKYVMDLAQKMGGEIESSDTRMSGELPVKFKGQWQAWQFISFLAKAWGHLGDKLRKAEASITLPSGMILFVPVREMTP